MWGKAKKSVNNVSLIFTLNNQMAPGEIGTHWSVIYVVTSKLGKMSRLKGGRQ